MKNRKRLVSILSGVMAAIMLLTLLLSILPTHVSAASSSEIRKQINQLKKEKAELKEKIDDVKDQYQQNENEIADIIARKNVIDQEVQLLSEQITNMNDQLSAYNLLIADKQDELDNAEGLYDQLNEENKVRVRTMEEEGEISYWEVLFKANSFSDLLDRLNMVEEIAASDNRRLKQLSDAADAVEVAQVDLQAEGSGRPFAGASEQGGRPGSAGSGVPGHGRGIPEADCHQGRGVQRCQAGGVGGLYGHLCASHHGWSRGIHR